MRVLSFAAPLPGHIKDETDSNNHISITHRNHINLWWHGAINFLLQTNLPLNINFTDIWDRGNSRRRRRRLNPLRVFKTVHSKFDVYCRGIEESLIHSAVLLRNITLAEQFISSFIVSFELMLKNPEALLVTAEALNRFKLVVIDAVQSYAEQQRNKIKVTTAVALPSTQPPNAEELLVTLDENCTRKIATFLPQWRSQMSYNIGVGPSGLIFGSNSNVKLLPAVKKRLDRLLNRSKRYRRKMLRHYKAFGKFPKSWKRGLNIYGAEEIEKFAYTEQTLMKRVENRQQLIVSLLLGLDSAINGSILQTLLIRHGLHEDIFDWLRACLGATIAKGVLFNNSECSSQSGSASPVANSVNAGNSRAVAILQSIIGRLIPRWIMAAVQSSGQNFNFYSYLDILKKLAKGTTRLVDLSAVTNTAWEIFQKSQELTLKKNVTGLSKTEALNKTLNSHFTKQTNQSDTISTSESESDSTTDDYSTSNNSGSDIDEDNWISRHSDSAIQNWINNDPLLQKTILDPSISDTLVTKKPDEPPQDYFHGIWPDHFPRITFDM